MDVLRRRFLLVFLCAILSPPLYAADTIQLGERQIKAGLLYNFVKYTQWPASSLGPGGKVEVCIFGADPFEGGLQPMESRTVNGHGIDLRYIGEDAGVQGCHLLYVNAAEKERWPSLQQSIAGKPILTVSDFAGFASSQGMIEFGHKGDHIIAILNMGALSASGLQVEERLLKLVTVMQDDRS